MAQLGNTIVSLGPVEELITYEFLDANLGRTALATWRQGFSRLEFLGDSILGLAVFSTSEIHHIDRQQAIARVSNHHLDSVFNETFAGHTSSNSGDVIEALIGAVHLDGGYEEAARVATALCLPEHQLAVPPVHLDDQDVSSIRSLSFVGAAVLSAAVADELCRENPGQTHRWFSEQRTAALSRWHLAEVSMRLKYSPEGDLEDEKFRAKASDALEAAVGEQYFRRGWDVARNSSLRIVRL